jgi:ABC-type Fe3+-hydroxamate transport system substrate-binding protein
MASESKKKTSPLRSIGEKNEPKPQAAEVDSRIGEVVALLSGELSDVRFPDVSGESLLLQCESVSAAEQQIAALQQQLAAARDRLREQRAELFVSARRAVSYAMIYAEGNDALTRRIELLELADARPLSSSGATAPIRLRKKRKAAPPATDQGTLLFLDKRA